MDSDGRRDISCGITYFMQGRKMFVKTQSVIGRRGAGRSHPNGGATVEARRAQDESGSLKGFLKSD